MRGPKSTCVLEKPTETQDADNGKVAATWATVSTFQGVLTQLTAKESLNPFDKETVFASHKLNFDYYAPGSANLTEVKEKNRIRIGTRYFDIQNAVNRHNRFWEIDALETKGHAG